MPKPTDPCKKYACLIQSCLQDHKYQESKCQDVINAMLKCCESYGAESACCDGFKESWKKPEKSNQ